MLKCLLALACLVTLASAQSLNLAFGKQTYQSSTYRSSTHEGDSYQAVDGNADPAMGYSCTSTTYEDTAPWWRVDLDGSYEISHLDIVNRGGGHGKRLRNFEVRVEKEYGDSGSLCHHYNGAVEQGATVIITCDQPVRGRYVLIRKVDPQLPYPDHLLTLCEVRVFGESIDHCETNPCLNGGTCTADGADSYTCLCAAGYTGTNCETESIDHCETNPCLNGGTCTADGADSYTCLCAAGYTGTNCETAGECEPDVGRCVKKSCPCRDGYRSNHTCAKGKNYCCVPDDDAHLLCGCKWRPCRKGQD